MFCLCISVKILYNLEFQKVSGHTAVNTFFVFLNNLGEEYIPNKVTVYASKTNLYLILEEYE